MPERFPLDGLAVPGSAVKADGRSAITLSQRRPGSIVEIALWSGMPEVRKAIAAALGVGPDLPDSNRAVAGPGCVAIRIAPDRYLAVAQEPGLAARLRDVVSPDAGAVIDLTHGRTGLRIAGARAETLLQKGLYVDLDQRAFPPMSTATGALHHMAVVVWRVDAETFDIYAMSSFAASLWDWATDAAREYGWRVEAPAGQP